MKYINFLTIGVFCLAIFACGADNNTKTNQEETPAHEEMVGNDRDEHGCIASAGYQWSVLKNECIQIFASGIRMDPQDPSLNETMSAFVVFADDAQAQAEVFIPETSKSILLNKTDEPESAGTWIAGDLKLMQWRGMYILERNEKTIYQGPAVR